MSTLGKKFWADLAKIATVVSLAAGIFTIFRGLDGGGAGVRRR